MPNGSYLNIQISQPPSVLSQISDKLSLQIGGFLQIAVIKKMELMTCSGFANILLRYGLNVSKLAGFLDIIVIGK